MKRSAHLKQWRQRFFVLKGDTLYSFKNRGEHDLSEADGRTDIHNVYKIAPRTTVGEATERENMFQVKLGSVDATGSNTAGAAKQSKETELFLAATSPDLRK